MNSPHINQLRIKLLETLDSLTNKENPMEPDRARAVAQVASVLVDTARVEVDYIKATGSDKSNFLEIPPDAHVMYQGSTPGACLPNGIASITRHHLKG